MKHSFVRYIRCVHIASQKIKQIQAYHRKTYCGFTIQRCYSSQQKTFLSYKVANKSYKGVFSKFLYLIAKWSSHPKPIILAILKSALKYSLPLSIWAADGIFRKSINFQKFRLPLGFHGNRPAV